MANFVMRDLPADAWGRAMVRAQLEGWPMQDLILRLLDGYVAGQILPEGPPPRTPAAIRDGVVPIRFTCPKCNRSMEVACQATRGFGYMNFHAVECPHCHQITERQLPGDIVTVSG